MEYTHLELILQKLTDIENRLSVLEANKTSDIHKKVTDIYSVIFDTQKQQKARKKQQPIDYGSDFLNKQFRKHTRN